MQHYTEKQKKTDCRQTERTTLQTDMNQALIHETDTNAQYTCIY